MKPGSVDASLAILSEYFQKNICDMYTSTHPKKALSLPYSDLSKFGQQRWHVCSILTHETASRLNTPEIFNRYRSSIGEELNAGI